MLHHLVADGWSIGVIVDDLMAGYNQTFQKRAPSSAHQPSELPLQHTAYSAWIHSALRDGVLAPKALYWEKQLKGARLLNLPADSDAPRNGPSGTVLADVQISADTARCLDDLAADMGTSTFAVIMTVYQVGKSSSCLISPYAQCHSAELAFY